MTGWILCTFHHATCALCGRRSNRVWRYFATESTSTMSVCEHCADGLHTPTEQEES